MTTTAIIMLIVAILVIWGGLALAIANLATRGHTASAELAEFELQRDQ